MLRSMDEMKAINLKLAEAADDAKELFEQTYSELHQALADKFDAEKRADDLKAELGRSTLLG